MTIIANERRPIVLWLVSIAIGLAAVTAVLRHVALRHLERSAEAAALHHAQLLGAAVPGLADLLQRGRLDEPTVQQLRSLRRVGTVFRFKLFAQDGRQVLVSDDLDKPAAGLAPNGALLGDEHGKRSDVVSRLVLSGQNFIELKDGTGKKDRPPAYSEAYVPLLRDGQVMGVVEVYVDQTELKRNANASFTTVALTVALVLAALGGISTAHWMRRLRAQRRAEERVRYLAQHDVLSGALNRASLNDELERAAWCAEAGGPGFAVLCVDLDRFKEVNDGLGHAAGDEVIRQVAQRLRALLRHGDHVARLGGDEFAILQSGVTEPADVTSLAQRVVDTLAAPYEFQGHPIVCGGSAGAAIFGVDSKQVDDLLRKADLALYRAKADGRGSFSFYEAGLDRHLHERRELAHDLGQAIESDAMTLHYQPLYAADGTTLNGYEALARWTHPQRGNVPPGDFIPVAEETGLIEALGRWVLRQACAEAATWPEPLTVSVNLSAAQFRNDALIRTVIDALGEARLPPERLEVEITESLLMVDTDRVVRSLHALSALGVRIAMDDFGTGYSSLAYLWRFPFDKVKIDRAFTKGLAEDPKVNLIVRSIVSLAHALHIRVNAEGVESEGQMRALQKHGCDELQGFLLGRPLPAEQLVHHNAAEAPPERPDAPQSLFVGLPTMPAPL
ncbi:MAG TPA: bifunctional diguanylate cyclase/phosphodiesterase [Burkholderiaceae bacterium]